MKLKFITVCVFNVLLLGSLLYQILKMSIKPEIRFKSLANELYQQKTITKANRGQILDRNGRILAESVSRYDIWIDPKKLNISHKELNQLSKILNIDEVSLTKKLSQPEKRFIYLARGIDQKMVLQIKKEINDTIHINEVEQRFYPYSSASASLIGVVNSDGVGIDGIELMYNDILNGKNGYQNVQKDRHGHVVKRISEKQPVSGKNITLSIDGRMQYQAYEVLKETVNKSHAESASAVILDVKSGQVRAMVNYPSIDPNQKPIKDPQLLRNRAVTDLFEPGSTIKPLALAYLLDTKACTEDDLIDARSGEMMLDGHKIQDVHVNKEKIRPQEILQKSSNVGMAKLMIKKPSTDFAKQLNHYGFCQKTVLDLPGEISGLCSQNYDGLFNLAALSFGYGFAISTLQLAQSYLTLANGGYRQDLSILDGASPRLNEHVFSENTANTVNKMLMAVVGKYGTGSRASIKGVEVSGKTGTSNFADKSGYNQDQYIASFVGIVPTTAPAYVVAVVVRKPDYKYRYGGKVAAPAFANIVSAAMSYE